MPKDKVKVTIEIPLYLKEWIDRHDLGQNALATMGLRFIYQQELKGSGEYLMQELLKELRRLRLPF